MKTKINKLKGNIILMYAMVFFHNLIFAYVIERVFSHSRGITLEMLALLEIIYNMTIILLEVPSGYLADVFSRKKILIASALLGCFEFILIIFAQNIWMFMLATLLAGISTALSSGADNALLFDSLKLLGREQIFNKYLSRLRIFDYSAGIIAALGGAYMASRGNLVLTYKVSLISCIIVLICTIFLYEVPQKSQSSNLNFLSSSFMNYSKVIIDFKSVLSIFKNRYILMITFCGAITAGVVTQIDEYYQYLLMDINLPIYMYGYVSLFSLAACTLGSVLSAKFENRFKNIRSISRSLGLFALTLVSLIYFKSLWVILPLFFFYLIYSVIEPAILANLHACIDDELRATSESFYSLIIRVFCMLFVLPFAIISQRVNIRVGISFLFVSLVISTIIMFRVNNKNNDLNF